MKKIINERIDSKQFIELCHANNKKMSQPTLSRKITDNDFVKLVGAKKEMTETSKIPAWTFDANLSTIYAQTSDAKATPEKAQTALVKTTTKAIAQVKSENNAREKQQQNIENILLIPHKIYLTLDEAKLLTGFPKSELFKISELKFRRRVIKKSNLEKL